MKKRMISTFTGILVLVLIITVLGSCAGSLFSGNVKSELVAWDKLILGNLIPEIEDAKGEIFVNGAKKLSLRIDGFGDSEYRAYVKSCQKSFSVDKEDEDDEFKAFNSEGFRLELRYSGSDERLFIEIEEPRKLRQISWPESEAGKRIPAPSSDKGVFEYEHEDNFFVYVGEITKSEYDSYVSECMKKGFDYDYDKDDGYFWGKDSDGWTLEVRYEGFNTISIYINNPPEEVITESEQTETERETVTETVKEGPEETVQETEPISTVSKPVKENASSSIEIYSNKAYYVDDDMPANGYIVTCTSTEYSMQIIVFESKDNYKDFQNADKSTIGEYSTTVEQYAWVDYYLNKDEQVFVSLQKGNVILLDNGACNFTKFNPNETNTIYRGVYVVGKDIDANKDNIKCISDYLNIITFESKETYLNYHKSNRWTIGEEWDAIVANAATNESIYEGYSTFVNLADNMILMLDGGNGEYSVDSGPVIN